MTTDEAVKHLDELFSKPEVPEKDEPLFVECLTLLANEPEHELCGEAQYYIGNFYNQNNRRDLTVYYWERSAENAFKAAYAGLGDLFFYEEYCDYEKACPDNIYV